MTLDYEGFIESYYLCFTFIIIVYCLFGTQLETYVCSTSRKGKDPVALFSKYSKVKIVLWTDKINALTSPLFILNPTPLILHFHFNFWLLQNPICRYVFWIHQWLYRPINPFQVINEKNSVTIEMNWLQEWGWVNCVFLIFSPN